MQTGENTEGLRKITDMTRACAILLLGLHFYIYCYKAFATWHLTHPILTGILVRLGHTPIFNGFYTSKGWALILLIVSLIGQRGERICK